MRRAERPGPGQESAEELPFTFTASSTNTHTRNSVDIAVHQTDGTTWYDSVPDYSKTSPLSQSEIKDELDYATSVIRDNVLSGEAMEVAWSVVREIMRLSGDDMPVDILEKVGAVLSSKNKGNLKQAQNLIQNVLDSAEPQTQEEENLDASQITVGDIRRELRLALGLQEDK